jgi:hypothetical protein
VPWHVALDKPANCIEIAVEELYPGKRAAISEISLYTDMDAAPDPLAFFLSNAAAWPAETAARVASNFGDAQLAQLWQALAPDKNSRSLPKLPAGRRHPCWKHKLKCWHGRTRKPFPFWRARWRAPMYGKSCRQNLKPFRMQACLTVFWCRFWPLALRLLAFWMPFCASSEFGRPSARQRQAFGPGGACQGVVRHFAAAAVRCGHMGPAG